MWTHTYKHAATFLFAPYIWPIKAILSFNIITENNWKSSCFIILHFNVVFFQIVCQSWNYQINIKYFQLNGSFLFQRWVLAMEPDFVFVLLCIVNMKNRKFTLKINVNHNSSIVFFSLFHFAVYITKMFPRTLHLLLDADIGAWSMRIYHKASPFGNQLFC